MKTQTEIKIKVSEIKKGDTMKLGNTTYQAYSDAYLDGVWKFDLYGGFTYGFTSDGSHTVTVKRNGTNEQDDVFIGRRGEAIDFFDEYQDEFSKYAKTKGMFTKEDADKKVNMHDEFIRVIKFSIENINRGDEGSAVLDLERLLKQVEQNKD